VFSRSVSLSYGKDSGLFLCRAQFRWENRSSFCSPLETFFSKTTVVMSPPIEQLLLGSFFFSPCVSFFPFARDHASPFSRRRRHGIILKDDGPPSAFVTFPISPLRDNGSNLIPAGSGSISPLDLFRRPTGPPPLPSFSLNFPPWCLALLDILLPLQPTPELVSIPPGVAVSRKSPDRKGTFPFFFLLLDQVVTPRMDSDTRLLNPLYLL